MFEPYPYLKTTSEMFTFTLLAAAFLLLIYLLVSFFNSLHKKEEVVNDVKKLNTRVFLTPEEMYLADGWAVGQLGFVESEAKLYIKKEFGKIEEVTTPDPEL